MVTPDEPKETWMEKQRRLQGEKERQSREEERRLDREFERSKREEAAEQRRREWDAKRDQFERNMFIGPLIGAAGRGIAGAGRLAGSGAKWGIDPIKNHPVSQWVANHPIVQGAANNRIINNPATRLGAGAVGLMGGLALAGVRGSHRAASKLGEEEIGKKPALILIFPILLTIFDYFSGVNGIVLDSMFRGGAGILNIVWSIVTSAAYVSAVIIYWIVKKPKSRGEFVFPAVLFLLGFLILIFGNGSRWVFIHSVFAFITFMYLLDGFNADIKGVHWAFLVILFFDIFGLATINELYPGSILDSGNENEILSGKLISDFFLNRLLFPFWFFFYLFQIKPGKAKSIIASALVVFYTGFTLTSIITPQEVLPEGGLGAQQKAAKNAVVKAFDTWRDTISSWLTERIQYAVTGKVEQNEFEPLGVYLQDVQSADPRYYEDENVIVWGTVTARTLDDPINIEVGCFVKKDDEKIRADKMDPNKKFTVFALEEQDFACTFTKEYNKENKILEPGRNTIKAFADFNFETLAFLKVYFINRERQRAMVRQGLDPFEEFAIEDRNPIAVYTNGPAKIEMGTNNPLVSVSEDYIIEPSLDIRIDNREGWQGEIKKLKEFVLFLPDGINFDPQQSCGSMKFLDYNLSVCGDNEYSEFNNCCMGGDGNCTACTQSCQNFVVDECKDVCKGFENEGEKQRCNSDCDERGDVCKQSCTSFFVEGGQLYNGYALDTEDIKYRNEETDFEKGKLFRCRFRPTESVLGVSPFTTKSFRVKARYDYSLEEDVSVKIDEIPEDLKKLVGAPKNLRIIDKGGEVVTEGSISLENEITIAWDLSADDGKGQNDIAEYRIYRKESLEEGADWDKIGSVDAGITQYIDNSEKVRNAIASENFKFYYHVEAMDEDGNWAKSENMLEITSRGVNLLPTDAPTPSGTTPIPMPMPMLSQPTGSITINNGDETTASTAVTLSLSCESKNSCKKMKIAGRSADVESASEQEYKPQIQWTLGSDDGTKIQAVYVKFKDEKGFWSNAFADDINLELDLGETCGNLPDCATEKNNAKCQSVSCGIVSTETENKCGCILE